MTRLGRASTEQFASVPGKKLLKAATANDFLPLVDLDAAGVAEDLEHPEGTYPPGRQLV
jgi:hypothetical protein